MIPTRTNMTRTQKHIHDTFQRLLNHAANCSNERCRMCRRINGYRV